MKRRISAYGGDYFGFYRLLRTMNTSMSDLSIVPRMSADQLKTFLSENGFSETDMEKLRGKPV